MLPVCIRSYLKSVLRYTFLILDTCHLHMLYLREEGCEDPRLFVEAEGGSATKKVREIMIYTLSTKLSLLYLVFIRYSSVDCSVLSFTDIRLKTRSFDEDVRSEI